MMINLTDLGIGNYTVTTGSTFGNVLHFSGELISGTVTGAYQSGSVGFAKVATRELGDTIIPAMKVRDLGGFGCFNPPEQPAHILCA